LPDRLIIKEKLASIVDEVVADVDGINNQVSASSSKLGQAQTLAREVESLKGLAAQLADKWGKLVDWGFKIPKKLVESIKESSSLREERFVLLFNLVFGWVIKTCVYIMQTYSKISDNFYALLYLKVCQLYVSVKFKKNSKN